jgi:hypothetical protein
MAADANAVIHEIADAGMTVLRNARVPALVRRLARRRVAAAPVGEVVLDLRSRLEHRALFLARAGERAGVVRRRACGADSRQADQRNNGTSERQVVRVVNAKIERWRVALAS